MNGYIRFQALESLKPETMRSKTRTERILQEIDGMLKEKDASRTSIDGNQVAFETGLFEEVSSFFHSPFFGDDNLLLRIDSGLISVSEEGKTFGVSYHLKMLVAPAFWAVVFGLLGVAGLFTRKVDTISVIEIACSGWLLIAGVIYLVTMFRFRTWLEEGLLHLARVDYAEAAHPNASE